MIAMLWAGPASADHTNGHVLGPDQDRGGAGAGTGSAEAGGGQRVRRDNLARTDSNDVTPLIQAAVVLVGGGTMLGIVARRRQRARRATA